MTEYRVWYDDDTRAVWMKFTSVPSAGGIRQAMKDLIRELDRHQPRFAALDLREVSGGFPPDFRKAVVESAANLRTERQAHIISNPVVRMLSRTITLLIPSVRRAGYFKTAEEAASWLKEPFDG